MWGKFFEPEAEKSEVINHYYLDYIQKSLPILLKMKQPLTNEQAEALQTELGDDIVYPILDRMGNYKKVTDNISANLTIRNWHRLDIKKNGKHPNPGKTERIGAMAKSDMEEYLRRPVLVDTPRDRNG